MTRLGGCLLGVAGVRPRYLPAKSSVEGFSVPMALVKRPRDFQGFELGMVCSMRSKNIPKQLARYRTMITGRIREVDWIELDWFIPTPIQAMPERRLVKDIQLVTSLVQPTADRYHGPMRECRR